MAALITLITAQPRRAVDGVAETVRLAGGGSAHPYHYDGAHWRAGVEAFPTVIASLTYDGEISGGGVAEALAVTWSPNGHAGIDDLARYYWGDAAIVVRFGPEGVLPPILAQGKVREIATAEGKLTISTADPAADLMKPVPASTYAGTGDLEGPADWEKKIRRRVWGRIFNLEAEPLDAANNVYCLSDPLRPIDAILEVRERGVPVALTLQAWAGSAIDTLAALRAAIPPEGGAVVCPSIACIKFWTAPAALHADLRGEVGAGYVESTPAIAERIVQALGGPAFADGAVAAAAAMRPAPMGWLVDDETTNVSAMLTDMLANVSLAWMLEEGSIIFRPWEWSAPVAQAVSQNVARKQSFAPVTTRRLGYRRNESPMARGDLAAIVLATNLSYLDGTPIENLKPAEPGADITTTIVGVAEIRISAAYDGTVTETLPRLQAYRLIRNAVDVTDASSWAVSVQSGTIVAAIDVDGVLSLDASAGALSNSVLSIEATHNDRVYQTTVRATKLLALPPSNGALSASGGFTASVASTSMMSVSREISIEIGAAGQAALSASYSFMVEGAFTASFHVAAQWYRWNGTAYVALGSEQQSTDAAMGGRPSIGEPGEPGQGECSFTDSGQTPASVQKYRLYMRAIGTATARAVSGSYALNGS